MPALTTVGPELARLGIGSSEAETFRSIFLKRLVKRGLRGVRLVISDAHEWPHPPYFGLFASSELKSEIKQNKSLTGVFSQLGRRRPAAPPLT
jgi:hypothetical protein